MSPHVAAFFQSCLQFGLFVVVGVAVGQLCKVIARCERDEIEDVNVINVAAMAWPVTALPLLIWAVVERYKK